MATTWRSSLSGHSKGTYAYLVTLPGVILAEIPMIHTGVAYELRSHSLMNAGNYTRDSFTVRQFGTYTANFNGPQRIGYLNPYRSFVNDLAVIEIVGII